MNPPPPRRNLELEDFHSTAFPLAPSPGLHTAGVVATMLRGAVVEVARTCHPGGLLDGSFVARTVVPRKLRPMRQLRELAAEGREEVLEVHSSFRPDTSACFTVVRMEQVDLVGDEDVEPGQVEIKNSSAKSEEVDAVLISSDSEEVVTPVTTVRWQMAQKQMMLCPSCKGLTQVKPANLRNHLAKCHKDVNPDRLQCACGKINIKELEDIASGGGNSFKEGLKAHQNCDLTPLSKRSIPVVDPRDISRARKSRQSRARNALVSAATSQPGTSGGGTKRPSDLCGRPVCARCWRDRLPPRGTLRLSSLRAASVRGVLDGRGAGRRD